jgi:beta-glucanase (GH16 family)
MSASFFVQTGLVSLVAVLLCASLLSAEEAPPRAGLQLWLDANGPVMQNKGQIIGEWHDKSSHGHCAGLGDNAHAPKLVPDGMNGKPVLRFTGKEFYRVHAIRPGRGAVTIFVVSQRTEAQATDAKWQRLLSCWDGETDDDNKPPSFSVIADHEGEGRAYGPAIYDVHLQDVPLGALLIGRSARHPHQFFRGDVAEVLIYDRGFVAHDEVQQVVDYLAAKWGAEPVWEDVGWTRVGPLGETPKRVTNELPLSAQTNAGKWTKYEPLWDEFGGDKLDADKWHPTNPQWLGRQPALFWAENVRVDDGKLHLTMQKREAPDTPKDKGFHTYTSAAVKSKGTVLYGYFEISAKPMRSHGSSAFWFYDSTPDIWTEIDVFEIGGGAPSFERKYNMNLHVFHTPTEKKHWSKGGVWVSPFDLADAYHVYGLEWDKEELKYYVDGVVVRTVKNTHWHQPLTLNFDSETMPTWFGLPKDEDLPSTFSIEYVRAWKRAE